MLVTLSGMMRPVRDSQETNAPLPMLATLSGMLIYEREGQSANA